MRRAFPTLLLSFGLFACAELATRSAKLELENTHWTLASLGADRTPVPKSQTEPYLEFNAEQRRVTGSGGCNRLTCGYERQGDEIHFGLIASTRMACEHGMATEGALGAALEVTSKWAIVGGALELYAADGRLLASFASH